LREALIVARVIAFPSGTTMKYAITDGGRQYLATFLADPRSLSPDVPGL
jgi:hypothetical protein